MRTANVLLAFLGGAAVGAGVALLLAPEKGEDTRAQIKSLLRKYGVCKSTVGDELEDLVDEISEDIKGA